jgi:NAD(P)H-hydrate epimerase
MSALKLKLPALMPDAHKYTRGSLLVIAGSLRFPGAAILAAQAASLAGAGYTTLAVPASALSAAHAHLRSIPVLGCAEHQGAFAADALEEILAKVQHIDAVVLGPGISATPSALQFAATVCAWAQRTTTPLVLDADALQAVSPKLPFVSAGEAASANNALPSPYAVVTPHEGELAQLLYTCNASSADELAAELHTVVVAKGPRTHITDGSRKECCSEGTPALAKAGTGDVLSGIIGSLLAQGMCAFDAALAGVRLHAHAGCVAEAHIGARSVMAEHVLEALPEVLRDTL